MLNRKAINKIKLSTEEYKVYSKQIILDNIGIEGQKKLKQAKILIVGAGGLGCTVMMYLAISGIGHIGIIDQDKIEFSNLNRQILYSKNDINNLKVTSAKDKLQQINNNCIITEHPYNLTIDNSIEIICYYDILIDTTDNFNTRDLIDKISHKLHKTYIYGAVDKFEGHIAIFNYKSGMRYKDIYSKSTIINNNTCNRHGIMGINTGYIGILQAIEGIKTILGLNKKCKNFILLYNIIKIKNEKRKIYLKRNSESYKKIRNSRSRSLMSFDVLEKDKRNIIIIDLRKKNEFSRKHNKKAINIPINHFKYSLIIKLIEYYIKNKTLVLYCDTTEKSTIGSYFLTQKNIKHYILLI
uniref:Molybdopterin biosynthesis protein n=1 Tax=Dipterosiphonia australica TaxID=2007208 RepID=A0A1Z1MLF8_9FLOR|nr:Molybdopterin biosynthesis protein [Dipterosiphonia australica]ARW66913.1 Molybdopterin biosynthesis protein [Dipterosiphonia australica]